MSKFVENAVDFSAQCACSGGRCVVARENFLFLDDGNELSAVGRLQNRCGHVVIIPGGEHALLYHTSCQRMNDVVSQIFGKDALEPPANVPSSAAAEMTLGALYRRRISIAYERAKAKVEDFAF